MNKGFSSASLLELWYPEFGLSSWNLFQAQNDMLIGQNKTSPCGSCNGCQDLPRQIFPNIGQTLCKHSSRQDAAKCVGKLPLSDMHLYSFDGDARVVETVTKARDNLISDIQIDASIAKVWSVELAAFAETYEEGKTIRVIQDGVDAGPDDAADAIFSPVLTVDQISEREGIKHIDVLRIDTGAHVPIVLRGARRTLSQHKATVVLFEYHERWPRTTDSLKKSLDDVFGDEYACYLAGDNNLLLKLTQNCWTSQLEVRKLSNVWCISLKGEVGVKIAKQFDAMAVGFA
jgi:hypothetical protein